VLAGERTFATDTPQATIETLHSGLVASSSHARESDFDLEERYRALRPLIAATHDLRYIAEFTIRRQWRDLAPEQRDAFVAAFERLSVMTYATRFAELAEDTLQIVRASGSSGRAEVEAAINRPSTADIPLEYLLQESENGWRIINIVADGVSDLALKRAEFQRVLADGTIDDLIRHLEEQISRLMSSR
jgi:phospholipid transport system substrate-binding protein